MKILLDLFDTNYTAFKKTNKLIGEHHLLMYVGLIYGPLVFATSYLGSMLPLFGLIVTLLGYALVLSNYFYLIDRATSGYKTEWDDVKNGFTVYMRKIFGIMFIFWVANLLIQLLVVPLVSGFIGFALSLLFMIACFVVFNALPEVTYKKHHSEMDSVKYSMNFVKVNLLEWYVPNILLFAANYFIYQGLMIGFSKVFVNLPSAVAQSLSIVVLIVVLQFTLGYTMIYRGLLFSRLDSTTRQKRMFQRGK